MVAKSWTGTNGLFSDATWSDGLAPVAGDIATITTGTVTATALPNPIFISVRSSNASSGTLVLSGAIIAAGSEVTLAALGSNATLRLSGAAGNAGTITGSGSGNGTAYFRLDDAPGGGVSTFVNTGRILVSDANAQIVTFGSNAGDRFENDGLISFRNPSQTPHLAYVSTNLIGTGTVSLGCCTTLETFGTFGAGQTVVFERGIGSATTLRLDSPRGFDATLSGFAASDAIQMVSGRWDSYGYTATGTGTGTLSFSLGGTLVRSLNFVGNYTTASFAPVQNGPPGSGQTTTTISTTVAEVAPAKTDLNGDGTSDLLWQRSDGLIVDWSIKGAALASGGIVSGLDSSWQFLAAADLNADGKADLLWRQQGTGLIVDWQMDGSTITSGAIVAALGSDWDFLGASDLNGDGRADMLWRQQGSNLIVDWTMDGPSITSGAIVSGLDSSWSLLAASDFDGDGKSDLLWQHAGDGLIVDWTMNGPAIVAGGIVGALPANWHLLGAADTNGDGKSDLLWQDTNTGDIVDWQMDGSTVTSMAAVANLDSSWSVIGTGDYNGDGRSDIMWRNTSGLIVDWSMNGATIQSGAIVSALDSAWHPLV